MCSVWNISLIQLAMNRRVSALNHTAHRQGTPCHMVDCVWRTRGQNPMGLCAVLFSSHIIRGFCALKQQCQKRENLSALWSAGASIVKAPVSAQPTAARLFTGPRGVLPLLWNAPIHVHPSRHRAACRILFVNLNIIYSERPQASRDAYRYACFQGEQEAVSEPDRSVGEQRTAASGQPSGRRRSTEAHVRGLSIQRICRPRQMDLQDLGEL